MSRVGAERIIRRAHRWLGVGALGFLLLSVVTGLLWGLPVDYNSFLMDMSLPVMDGWEATRRIKDNQGTCAIPVIALTAHAMEGDREKALAAGANDYDTKPIEMPRLLEKIEALLQGKSRS